MSRLRRTQINAACLWLVCVCVVGTSRAQSLTDGAIAGVVESGPVAAVLLRNVETGLEVNASISHSGAFTLGQLSPGSYVLGSGGSVSTQVITVQAAETTHVRLRVVGSLVVVLNGAALDESINSLDPEREADGLRSSHGLQTQQADTVVDGVSADQSLEGAPFGSGHLQALDPADDGDSAESNTGPGHGLGRGRHAGITYLYAEGSTREFRVGAGGYSAQVGNGGGVLASVTRQGGTDFHGSAFLHMRSDIFAARDPLAISTSYADGVVTSNVVKPHDLREDFGTAFGGPTGTLLRVRYFVAAEGQRRGFPAISSPSDPSFYQLTPVQLALLGTRGVTTGSTAAALTYLSSLTGLAPRRADEDVEFGRLDWLVRPRLITGLQYNRARWNSPAGLLESPVVARGRASIGNASGQVDQVLARAETSLPGGLSQQLRFAFTRDLQYERPQTPLPQEPAIGPGGHPPEVIIGPDGLLFGTPASLTQVAYPDEHRFELQENISAAWHQQHVQFGASYSRVEDRVATLPNAAGTFRYDSGATGGKAGGLVDFITDYTFNVNGSPNGGCPSIVAAEHIFCFLSFSQSFGETRVGLSTGNWTAFVEDTWRPRTRISLHAGVRYEFTALPQPTHSNATLDGIFGVHGQTAVIPNDRNNLGPRAAAVLQPFGRGTAVLKIGYGVFFGRLPGATIASALTDIGLPSATARIRIRPSAITPCPQAPENGFGYPCSFQSAPTGIVAASGAAVVFDRRFRLPVVQQGSVTLEQEVGRKATLSVEALFNEDHQLATSTDINIAASTGVRRFQLQGGTGAEGVRNGESFVVPVYTNRISPAFGPVTDIVSTVNGTYDGLILRSVLRPVNGLQVSARYIWSRAIDFGQAASATPRTNGQFDPFANRYDKGLSSLNYPHALHATIAWTPLLETGTRLRALTNGWTISSLTTARSGSPYSLDILGGTYLPGGYESINGSGGALYLPTVGRNTLRMPTIVTSNLRVTRRFRVRSKVYCEASGDAFNLFNHQNVSSVNQRAYLVGSGSEADGATPLIFQDAAHIALEGLNTTPFGTKTGTGSSLSQERRIQLSLRASF